MPKLHAGYVVAAVGYMVGIFLLSSSGGESSAPAASQLVQNLLHIPLFAGLAACLLLAVADGRWYRPVRWSWYGIISGVAGAYAVFDEWHQSFVANRIGSVGDFVLDCVGVVVLLLVHRLSTRADRRTAEPLQAPGAAP